MKPYMEAKWMMCNENRNHQPKFVQKWNRKSSIFNMEIHEGIFDCE